MRTILLTFLVTGGALALVASETRVRISDLPAAVRKTVREQTQNAKILGFNREIEHGRTYYEAETTVNGRTRDILIDSGGAVVEIEEQTALESLPEAARKTLEAQAGSGKILRVESVAKGSQVSYEAVVLRNGRKSEVAVEADGAIKK